MGASECATVHRCIASTPLHYDSYIAIFIISAVHRCPRSRLTSIVFFLLVFFLFFFSLPRLLSRVEKPSSFLANHCRWIQGSSARTWRRRVALRRATSGSLNGELTRGDPSGCPLRRDANSRGLTRRRGERHIATFNLCFHSHCYW